VLENELRRFRERSGLTQRELAGRCGVSRQAINALEAGRYVPGTALALQLARVLGCRVEDLFRLDDAEPAIEGAALAPSADPGLARAPAGGPALLARVGDRWVAHRMGPDTAHPGNARIERTRRAGRPRLLPLVPREILDQTLLVAGCAPALAVLSQRVVERHPGSFLHWLDATSTRALDLLHAGLVHLAGMHLLDEDTGEFNRPIVARRFPEQRMACVTLARWQQGIVLRPEHRARLRSVEDLLLPGLRLARREPGAGTEKLLQRLLARQGGALPPAAPPFASGHLAVARAVAEGAADAGIAAEAVALAFGLDFVPLAEERFELVLHAELADDPRGARLLDLLSGRGFRRELAALGGYDPSGTGELFVVGAAA
jgi:molybdate-binding protein/DNA-binding XRE family transcriptional regulator